jgi:hypothetical protein
VVSALCTEHGYALGDQAHYGPVDRVIGEDDRLPALVKLGVGRPGCGLDRSSTSGAATTNQTVGNEIDCGRVLTEIVERPSSGASYKRSTILCA